MPEVAPDATSTYSTTSLIDNSPAGAPYSGAWNLIITGQQSPKPISEPIRVLSTPAVNQESRENFIREWLEQKDPFTQADLLDTEEDQIQELIFRIRTTPSIPYRETLANRLITLFSDAKEENVDSVGIALGSLRSFYSFLRSNTNLKCPTISLTPENNIYASWRGERSQVFSIHFLPNEDVRFVIFKPNDRHPEKQIRISGTTTTDTLMETVTPNGLMDWTTE